MSGDDIGPLPDNLLMRGGDPALVGKELLDIIAHAIAHQPRTLQKAIGPSEIGHPCQRRLGYKLLSAPDMNKNQGVGWKPFIGTCVHHELEGVFADNNLFYRTWFSEDHDRWLGESKVNVGALGYGPDGTDIEGHSDLYDRVTCGVIDWKIVGPNPLKNYKAHGPGQQYRTQAHAYGRGFVRRGLPVDYVMIVFLPRNGELMPDTHIWFEPYDESVALAGLERVNAIKTVTDTLGRAGLAHLKTADAYCYRCPFFTRDSVDLQFGCPGHPTDKPAAKPALSLGGKPS